MIKFWGRTNYSFHQNRLSRNRIALYLVVLAIFIFAAASLASYATTPSSESSGYIVTKDDKQDSPVSSQINKISGVSRIDDVQSQLDKLKLDINLFSSNLTTCYQATSDLASQTQSCNKDVATCKADFLKLSTNKSLGEQTCLAEKTGLESTIASLKTTSDDMNKTITALSTTYDSLKKQYADLTASIGNNICCKAHVDNQRIKFYRVENNKIICSEDSGTAITCP